MKTAKMKNALACENPVWRVLCVLVLTSAAIAIAQPPTYIVTDLGALGGETSRALSLNDQGQITGASLNGETSTTKVCVYWDSKTPTCPPAWLPSANSRIDPNKPRSGRGSSPRVASRNPIKLRTTSRIHSERGNCCDKCRSILG